jgi:hypothetical protein
MLLLVGQEAGARVIGYTTIPRNVIMLYIALVSYKIHFQAPLCNAVLLLPNLMLFKRKSGAKERLHTLTGIRYPLNRVCNQ